MDPMGHYDNGVKAHMTDQIMVMTLYAHMLELTRGNICCWERFIHREIRDIDIKVIVIYDF